MGNNLNNNNNNHNNTRSILLKHKMADPGERVADQRWLPAGATSHESIQRQIAQDHQCAFDRAVWKADQQLARDKAERQRRGERDQPQRIVQQVQRRERRANDMQQSTSCITKFVVNYEH